jgi:hypothetical protein
LAGCGGAVWAVEKALMENNDRSNIDASKIPLSQKIGLWVASALAPPFLLIPFMMFAPHSAQYKNEDGFGWSLLGLFFAIPALAVYLFFINSLFLAFVNIIKFSHRGAFITFAFLISAPMLAIVAKENQGQIDSELLPTLIFIGMFSVSSSGLLTSWLAEPRNKTIQK